MANDWFWSIINGDYLEEGELEDGDGVLSGLRPDKPRVLSHLKGTGS